MMVGALRRCDPAGAACGRARLLLVQSAARSSEQLNLAAAAVVSRGTHFCRWRYPGLTLVSGTAM